MSTIIGMILVLVLGAAPAQAGPDIPSVPRMDAADYTPRIVDDSLVTNAGVRELRQVGSVMFAGGDFQTVLNAAGTRTRIRHNIVSFNPVTGRVTGWAPNVDGVVYAMEPSTNRRYLFIGGEFSSFAGVLVNGLVKYDLRKRRVVTAFRFPIVLAKVSDLQLISGRLVVAGTFPGGIVAVSPRTGAPTPYLDGVQAAGQEPGYSTRVYRFAVNPAGTRMVVIGSFTSVGGQPRQQVALLALGSAAATLSPWSSTRWEEGCSAGLRWYSRDVDWTPDGSAFVIVTTGSGYPGTRKLCDTASLWHPVDAGDQEPVWINYSGGDTFHSVNATNRAIFVSGHFRWLDNPLGRDFKGPGAVVRRGLGALDLATGKALAWNPTKSLEGGKGGFDLYFTKLGLWVGHFEKRLGTSRELHEGLGLLPY